MKKEHKAPKEYTRGVYGKTSSLSPIPHPRQKPHQRIEVINTVHPSPRPQGKQKERFHPMSRGASFSKTTLFLSNHSVQNKQRGATIQTLFRFLLTLTLCQARRSCRTVRGNTQLASVIAKRRSHNILALEQWISK